MRKITMIAVALAAALSLTACGGLSGLMTQSQAVAVKAEQNSKPRQRVATLAEVLKQTKDGLAAEFTAGRMQRAEFLTTEAPVSRATEALNQAGELLKDVDSDRKLAAASTSESSRLKYVATAAAKEAFALKKSDDAEADITPLRELFDRVRGVPQVVAVPAS